MTTATTTPPTKASLKQFIAELPHTLSAEQKRRMIQCEKTRLIGNKPRLGDAINELGDSTAAKVLRAFVNYCMGSEKPKAEELLCDLEEAPFNHPNENVRICLRLVAERATTCLLKDLVVLMQEANVLKRQSHEAHRKSFTREAIQLQKKMQAKLSAASDVDFHSPVAKVTMETMIMEDRLPKFIKDDQRFAGAIKKAKEAPSKRKAITLRSAILKSR